MNPQSATTPPDTLSNQRLGPRSLEAFARAQAVFPDGTSRVTIERDPSPRYVSHGEGAYLVDLDGRRFLDLNANFTTLIHGHAFLPVVEALERQLRSGACFANPTEPEIALASLICERVPHLDRIRFVNTGSEAVMFAIKAARAFTGRSAVAKIEGAFHGAYDCVEVSQASTPADWGDPDSPASTAYYRGAPVSLLEEVVVLRFNDAEGATRRLSERAKDLAAIILDPMPSRAGLIAPEPAFLEAVRETASARGILVISDEVLNFRQGYRGAAHRYGLVPDLFALGKIIGGGLPIGAVGGRAEVMAVFDAAAGRPPVPQGGTFSANPLSMVAGLAAMRALDAPAFARLDRMGDALRAALNAAIATHDAPFCVTGAASLFRIHPKRKVPRDFREAYCDARESKVVKDICRHFAEHGMLLPASAMACLSTPMGMTEIALIADVFDRYLATRRDSYAGLKP